MKKLSLLMSALLVSSSFAAMAAPVYAEENNVLAHWKFQNDPAYYEGNISSDDLTFYDLSGNGNTLVTKTVGNGKDLSIFEWDKGVSSTGLTEDANTTALLFNNSLDQAISVDPYAPEENSWTGAYTSGKYFETVDGAPLNSWNGEGGWTIEVIFKVSPDFNYNYNRYAGMFSRQGVLSSTEEPPYLIAISAPVNVDGEGYMGDVGYVPVQFAHTDASGAMNKFDYGEDAINVDEWHHFMVSNDGEITDAYLDGEYLTTVSADDSIHVTDASYNWDVGVGRKDFGSGKATKNENQVEGIIRRLFCGTISEIKVTKGYTEDLGTSLIGSFAAVENTEDAPAPAEDQPSAAVETPAEEAPVVEETPVAEETSAEEAPAAEETEAQTTAETAEEIAAEEPAEEKAETPAAEKTSSGPVVFVIVAVLAAVIAAAAIVIIKKRK